MNKLEKLQELIQLADSGLTRSEFEDNFKIIIDLVRKLKAEHKESLDSIDTKYLLKIEELLANLRNESWNVMDKAKKEAMDYCQEMMASMHKEMKDKMDSMENGKDGEDSDPEEVAQLAADKLEEMIPEIEEIAKDLPKLGAEIRNGLELLPDGEKLSIEAIQDLRKELDDLEARIGSTMGKNVLGGGMGIRLDSIYSQTGQVADLNTLATSHTIHTIISFIINGQGQHLTSDYTFTGNTITYVTPLDSSFTGTNFTLTYV
jgi:uncharacterized protein (DUF885 family)